MRARSVVLLARLSAIVVTVSSRSVGISCFSWSCNCRSLFLWRLSLLWQSFIRDLTGRLQSGFDDLDGLLCVQRGLKFEPGRNKAVIFTAMIELELFSYSPDSACVGDVVVRKSFALSSK